MTTVHGDLIAGRWRLGDLLGRGAVADVYEAVDDESGERVAVKIVRHADGDRRARFDREIAALEALDHPAIVGVRSHGDLDGRPFVVLDCVDGGSLAAELTEHGPFPADRACRVAATVAEGLAHAHAHGVVHRDVKPSNVLLDDDGRPLLADFGVAQLDGSASLTASGFTVGTAAYLAPEQVRGEPIGPPTDVYALGLVLLESLTGERAYDGSGIVAAMARLERPPTIPSSVPPPLAERIRAMTAMAPDERPPAATVAADLSALAEVPEGDGTSVLPVVDDATEIVPVVPATTPAGPRVVVPPPDPGAVPEPTAIGADDVATTVAPPPWRRLVFAAICFLAAFLVISMVRSLADEGGVDVPTTVVTTVPTTTPPTTVPPTTAAPPQDEGRGNGDEGGGNGNEGGGNGNEGNEGHGGGGDD